MEEWTDRLRHRREEIIARLEAMGTPKVGTRGFQEQPHLNQELVTIEQTLAQVESTKALRRDTAAREMARTSQDDAAFWWRRFTTSLAIGNGAGFAVVTTGILQSSRLNQALVFGWEFAIYFGLGVLCAGVLPLVFWAQRRFKRAKLAMRIASICLTTLAGGFFVLGVGWAVYRISEAQESAGVMAKAERQVERVELAKRLARGAVCP